MRQSMHETRRHIASIIAAYDARDDGGCSAILLALRRSPGVPERARRLARLHTPLLSTGASPALKGMGIVASESLHEEVRMLQRALLCLSALIAGVNAAGEPVCVYQGVEIQPVSVERAKAFRDLEVKNERKHDLAIVRVSAKWSAKAMRLLIKDSEIKVVDAKGKSKRCALKFIQAHAPQDLSSSTIEIPFRVDAGVALKELRIGKSILDLSNVPESTAPSKAPSATPAPPQ
jgi:hypothetical protein